MAFSEPPMDALPTSPEDRASLLARYEPLQAAYDDLYERLLEALPRAQLLAAANQLRLLRGMEIVADEYDEEVLDDYALHLELAEEETFLTRMLTQGFVEPDTRDERLLRAMTQARFSFYEITKVASGLGFEVHDLLRDCRTCVVIGEAPETLQPGHVFMGRLLDVDGIRMLGSAGLPVPKEMAVSLAKTVREDEELAPIGPDAREPMWLSQALLELFMKLKKEADTRQEPARSEKIGRNDPCRCGSGRKYKKCCGALN